MRGKVILLEPVLAHYRRDLYKYLLTSEDFDFEILAGTDYQGIKSLEGNDFTVLNYFSCRFLKRRFYYLKGSIRYILSRKPEILMCGGVDFHHIHTIILFFLFRIILWRKFFWWTHGTAGNQGRIGLHIRKFFYRTASGVLVYSVSGKETLNSMGIKNEKIKVISNAINREDYGYLNHNLNASRNESDTFRILFSGRITLEKRLELLVRTMQYLIDQRRVDVACWIIGAGDIGKLNNLACELDVSNHIKFIGAKYGKDVHEFFSQADLFVYPGGIGLAILHAYSYGLPVITTDNMGLQMPEIELLAPGLTGDFYRDDSIEDLGEKIIQWKNNIAESREIIQNNCFNRIDELGYLPDKMGNSIISYFKERSLE